MKTSLLIVFGCIFLTNINSNLAIINGRNALTNFAHHAFVQYLNENNAGLTGGGSLISSLHVITTGKAIHGFVKWNVGLGSQEHSHLQFFTSNVSHLHPNYVPGSRNNDIGIIVLPNAVVFTADISPISLPPLKAHADIDFMHPYENEEGIITGFGEHTSSGGTRSPMLLQGFVRIIDDKKCKAFFNLTTPNHFCAQNTINRSNICNSDIGGSLTIQIERKEILVGISSLVLQFCSDAEPSAYTRISMYREWIRNVTSV